MLKTIRASSPAAADLYGFDELVQEDRVHRLIYTHPVIFQAELTNIWGAVWIYLGHESQIPSNNDFITARLGLHPIILIRDAAAKLRALFNRCLHRGTTRCRKERGNARMFTCPYHGWSYLSAGLANFEEIQRGLACLEDEWVYMHRGLGIPGRVTTNQSGEVTAPATDEAFMREYIKEGKRLMQASPHLVVHWEP